ncbi:phosphoglucomutase [Leptospira interrogans serovar Ricardi]|nr:phosphoglucomutase [Leptospira interrogans serovar Ricardi]
MKPKIKIYEIFLLKTLRNLKRTFKLNDILFLFRNLSSYLIQSQSGSPL